MFSSFTPATSHGLETRYKFLYKKIFTDQTITFSYHISGTVCNFIFISSTIFFNTNIFYLNMKILTITWLLFITITSFSQKLTVYDLSCEHKINPIGIDAVQPRLSWKIKSGERNTLQSTYIIRVSEGINFSSKNVIWESGKKNT